MGIPALEDGLFVNLLVFDYLYIYTYKYIYIYPERGASLSTKTLPNSCKLVDDDKCLTWGTF